MKVLPTQGWGHQTFLSHLCEHRLQWVGHSRTRWGLIAIQRSPSVPPGLILFSPQDILVHKVQVPALGPFYTREGEKSARASSRSLTTHPCPKGLRKAHSMLAMVLHQTYWRCVWTKQLLLELYSSPLCGSEGLGADLSKLGSMAPHPCWPSASPHGDGPHSIEQNAREASCGSW